MHRLVARLKRIALLATLYAPLSGLAGPLATGPMTATQSALSADWSNGPFMEIYVRAYRDTSGKGWGDLQGVIASLDYLQQLGIRGVWLMPITRSQDHDHGYAVTDYRDIEKDYGSLDDFDQLLKAAHARGIGIVIDYVINHSGSDHPLFAASRDPASPYRNWYVWQPQHPQGWHIYQRDPWEDAATGSYFAAFSRAMPDFNLTHPDVVKFHQDNLRFWLDRGVDGVRFDAVGHLFEHDAQHWNNQPENYRFMHDVQGFVHSYPNRYMVCEAPDDPAGFAAATGCGGAFGFGHQRDLIGAAQGRHQAIQNLARDLPTLQHGWATMLSNHDSFAGQRLWTQVDGDAVAYRLAAASYLLQPGTPFIFYGEEIGLADHPGLHGDDALRTPMAWNDGPHAGFTTGAPFRPLAPGAAQRNVALESHDPDSLLNLYRRLIRVRHQLPAISNPEQVSADLQGDCLVARYSRVDAHTVAIFNYGSTPCQIQAIEPSAAGQWKTVFDLLPSRTDEQAATVAPRSVRVLNWVAQ